MAWLELHQTLPTNKKTVRFKNLLHIKTPQAVGHLCILWLWALDNAPDGDLSGFTADEIAEFACWVGKGPEEFVEGLMQAGFLDDDMQLHDWYDYAGKLVEKRKSDAERKRASRSKPINMEGCPQDVQRTSQELLRDGAGNRTIPYLTVPNSTVPTMEDIPPIPPVEPTDQPIAPKPRRKTPSALTNAQEEFFNRFWAAYPRKVSIGDAEKAWKKISPDEALVDRIIAAVSSAKANDSRFRETRFTPHPAKWLNGREWENQYDGPEEPPTPPRGGKPNTLGVLEKMLNEEGGNLF